MPTVIVRKKGAKWETQDTHECANWVDAQTHVNECLEFIKDHIEVDFEVTSEPDYGGDRVIAVLTGWRDSTKKEIADRKAEEATFAQRARKVEEDQVERLRKSRPDLFK